jgi:hypothetical protein
MIKILEDLVRRKFYFTRIMRMSLKILRKNINQLKFKKIKTNYIKLWEETADIANF